MGSRVIQLCYIILFSVIVYLGAASLLDFYIHPRYILFTTIFAAIGLALVLSARKDSFQLSKVSFVLVLATAAVAFAFPPATLSSRQALFREGEQQFTQSEAEFSSYDLQSRDLSRYDIADWVSLLQTNPEPSTVVGSLFSVIGFYLQNENGSGQIARFRVSCCAIDATPLVVDVNRDDLVIDQWYDLDGTLQYNEATNEFFVAVEQAEPIDEPRDPYVF